MAIFISDNSALKIWDYLACNDLQRYRILRSSNVNAPDMGSLLDKTSVINELLRSFGLNKLELVIPHKLQKHNNIKISYITMDSQLPAHSFVKLQEGVYLATPELAYMQLITKLERITAIRLGCEICGNASKNFTNAYGDEQERPALTSKDGLIAFAQTCKRVKGAGVLKKIAKYIIDGTASEMELKLAMLMLLPKNLGGYGIKGSKQNPSIRLSAVDAQSYGTETMKPDFILKSRRLPLNMMALGTIASKKIWRMTT